MLFAGCGEQETAYSAPIGGLRIAPAAYGSSDDVHLKTRLLIALLTSLRTIIVRMSMVT